MSFDINQFMFQTPGGPLSTQYATPNRGDYPSTITKIEPRMVPLADGPVPVLEIHYAQDGFNGPDSRQSVWLSLMPDGSLDRSEGKNVELGLLYLAAGRNPTTDPIQSLVGARVLARYEADKKDDRFTRVTRTAPLTGGPLAGAQPPQAQSQAPAPNAQQSWGQQPAPQAAPPQPQGGGWNGQQAPQVAPQAPQQPPAWGQPQQAPPAPQGPPQGGQTPPQTGWGN